MAYANQPNSFAQLLGGAAGFAGGGRLQKAELRKGVYADYSVATPKYSATNDDRSLQTQARLLIPFPNPQTFQAYRKSFPGHSRDIKQLAETIAALGGSRGHTGYIDFLLTSAQESFEEKLQIVDVVGDNYVAYFFGQRPPLFSYQGVLMNTQQDDWRLAMLLMYQHIIRGTQLARRNTMVTLAYDNLAVTGALVNMTQVLTAEMQMASQFNFQLLVKRVDVERTMGAKPTRVSGLPSVVRPDTFATEIFDVPHATNRKIAESTSTTKAREAREEGSSSEIYISGVKKAEELAGEQVPDLYGFPPLPQPIDPNAGKVVM